MATYGQIRLRGFKVKLNKPGVAKTFIKSVGRTIGEYREKEFRKESIRRAKIIRDEIMLNAPSMRISNFIESLQIEKRFLFGSGYNYDVSSEGVSEFRLVINPRQQGDVAWATLISNEGRGPVEAKGKGKLAIPTSDRFSAIKKGGSPVPYDPNRLSGYVAGKFPRSFQGKYLKLVKSVKAVQGTGWIEGAVRDAEKKIARG